MEKTQISEYCYKHRLRICAIMKEIDGGSFPSLCKLSKLCKVSSKTIQRDLDFLRNCLNVPIDYDISKKGWFKTEASYSFGSVIRDQLIRDIPLVDGQLMENSSNSSLGGTAMLKAGLVIWQVDGNGHIQHLVEKELHEIDGWNKDSIVSCAKPPLEQFPTLLGQQHLDVPLTKERKQKKRPPLEYRRKTQSSRSVTSPEERAKIIEARIAGKGPTQIAQEFGNKFTPVYVSGMLNTASKTNPELRKVLGRDGK